MFKIGDKIVCIVENDVLGAKYNNIYTVSDDLNLLKNSYYEKFVEIKELSERLYNMKDFITLKEYRKIKLKKLCLKSEIK